MIGTRIGEYEILEIIGSGGMSTVYKAYQPSFDRYVAIKVMPRQLSEDPTFLKRFQREAKVVARLEHRSIIPVYEYGEHEQTPYIVMRLVEGGTLRRKLFYEYLDLPTIARIIEQVAEALDYAHLHGVIHRDLKPSNILLDEQNNAYLTDFGIAKMLGATSQITGSGVVGTPSYMSPEQCQGKELTGQSDIYALGAILFEMITGRPPYEADAPLTVMYMHVRDPIPSVRDIFPDMPPQIDQVIARAMAKRPTDRYPTAIALATDFKRAIAGLGVESLAQRLEPAYASSSGFAPDPVLPAVEPTVVGQAPVSRRILTVAASVIGLAVMLAIIGGGLVVLASIRNGGSNIAPPLPPTRTPGHTQIAIVTTVPLVSEVPLTLPSPTIALVEPSATNVPTLLPLAATRTPIPTFTPTRMPPTQTPIPATPTNTTTPTPTATIPTATPTATPTLTPTVPTPTNTLPPSGGMGWLAYNLGNNQSSEIAVIDANGQNFRTLTNNTYYDGEPDWSPDGSRVAFESERDGNMDIYVMLANGSGLQRLTTSNARERHPDWSPDGTLIAYEATSSNDAATEIYVMNADGSGVVQLTNNSFGDRAPQFSPAGTQIAYMTRQRGKYEIAIMAYPSGSQVVIFDCPAPDCRFPSWSPDGTRIAFNTLDGSGTVADIWVLTIATGQSQLLVGDGEQNGRPCWSDDGAFIFFNRLVDGNSDLHRINMSTGLVERLTTDARNEFAPDWGP